MQKSLLKESIIYKKDLILKSSSDEYLDEHEYILSKKCYDRNGNVTTEIHYDDSGSIIQEYVYNYNENGLLMEELMKDDDGFVAEHKSFEYDQAGRVVKEFRHYLDESFDTIVFHYDGDVLTRKETFDYDNVLENTEEFAYENGLLIHQVLKDSEANVLSEKKMTYDTDKRLVEVYDYEGSEDRTVTIQNEYYPKGNKSSVLTYDESGKLIGRVLLKEDDKGHIVEVVEEDARKKNTTNMVYDENGNVVQQEEIDMHGELLSKVERMYNERKELLESRVYISGAGKGLSRNYSLRNDYIFY